MTEAELLTKDERAGVRGVLMQAMGDPDVFDVVRRALNTIDRLEADNARLRSDLLAMGEKLKAASEVIAARASRRRGLVEGEERGWEI